MRRRSHPLTVSSELEFQHATLGIVISVICHPEEPMVRNYGDGSGHPGWPAEIELLSVTVNWWGVSDCIRLRSDGRASEYFQQLDELATRIVTDDWTYYQDLCEAHNE